MNATLLGHLGVWLSGAFALLGIADLAHARRHDRRGHAVLFSSLALLAIIGSVAVMQVALITHNFSLSYVAENNATFTPLIYSITGMWSNLEGSILLWALLLALATFVTVMLYRSRAADGVVQWATGIMFLVVAFFSLLMAGPADPFVRALTYSPQGAGPNALLQDNPLVAIHPPLLYTGFVGATVPFAFAMAMLITGRVGEAWMVELRRFTVITWGALSVGIVLGAWWSYQVLGWGGFWGWDPVENSALLPWLTGTAYLHSVIVQDRRGLLRMWNMVLAIATFALTILGTFFTRSGVVQSVHAFSTSTLGPILISFFALTVGAGAIVVAWRGDALRSPVGIESPSSREGLFVANNILFVGFAVVVLLGTVFPILYQAVNGSVVTVGAPYFVHVAAPASVVLLLLMAIAPLAGWRRASAAVLWQRLRPIAWVALLVTVTCEVAGIHRVVPLAAYFLAALAAGSALRSLSGSWRAARLRGDARWRALTGPSAGGMVVHLGIVMMAVAIVSATSFVSRQEFSLARGQSAEIAGNVVTFDSIRSVSDSLKVQTQLVVHVNGHTTILPAITSFRGRESQDVATPGIDSSLWRDVYVTLDAVGQGTVSGPQVASNLPTGSVAIGVTVEPMIYWMWIGGFVVGLGSLLSLWRRRDA